MNINHSVTAKPFLWSRINCPKDADNMLMKKGTEQFNM